MKHYEYKLTEAHCWGKVRQDDFQFFKNFDCKSINICSQNVEPDPTM